VSRRLDSADVSGKMITDLESHRLA